MDKEERLLESKKNDNLLGPIFALYNTVDNFTNTNTTKSKTVNSPNTIKSNTVNSPITSNDDLENTETPTSNSGGSLLSCVAQIPDGSFLGSTSFAGESDISVSNDLEDNDIIIENEEDKFFESELDTSQQSECGRV